MPAAPLRAKFRFLADEMIHGDLVAFLKKRNCLVMKCPKSIKNGEVYRLAKNSSRILLTQDKDFCESRTYPPESTEGIVCLRVFPPTINNQIGCMKSFIRESTAEKIKGKLIILT